MMPDPYLCLVESLQLMARSQDIFRDTHGNVSVVDRKSDLVWIKPSGMPYDEITPDDVCGLSLSHGSLLSWNRRKPSVDTVHHRSIYKRHPWIGAICHSHSPYASSFALAGQNLRCVSTEQADYFGGDVRCVSYQDLDSWGDLYLYEGTKAVLLEHHGVLTFADDPVSAVKLALALENIAMKTHLALQVVQLEGLSNRFYDRCLSKEEIEKWHRRYNDGTYGQK